MSWKSVIFKAFGVITLARLIYLFYAFHNLQIPDKFFYNTTQFALTHGYKTEEYNITTKDGGSLIIYRLLAKGEKSAKGGIPHLFLQGMFGSSDFAVILGPQKNFVYRLADEGVDVWLCNDRTTVYFTPSPTASLLSSRKGFREIGLYDLPAVVDFIVDKTGFKKISMSAFSLGAGKALVMLSEKPEYNQKISVLLLVTPSVAPNFKLWSHKMFHFYLGTVWKVKGFLDNYYDDSVENQIKVSYFTCQVMAPSICHHLAETVNWNSMGEETSWLLITRGAIGPYGDILADSSQNEPYGGSEFLAQDCGHDENIKKYNSTEPPSYNISQITAPTKIYFVEKDNMIDNELSSKLFRRMSNLMGEVILTNFETHGDVIVNAFADETFISDILLLLQQASQQSMPLENKPLLKD